MALRILIVGGTRFIGAHAARQLVETGAHVTVLHRGRSESPLLAGVRHIRDPRAAYPIAEYPDAVKADWDVVVHMILMGEADARVAASAFEGRAGRLVMISSGDVYRAYGRLTGQEPGPPEPMPLTEDAPLRSVLYPYRARAKEMGADYALDYEKILAERVTRAAAVPSVILRLPKVHGPEDNGGLATIYAFARQPRWRWTHGHVENVAHAIVLAATHPAAPGHAYNVGEAVTPTMGERLARLPAKGSGLPTPPFHYEQDLVYDTARIRTELEFCEVLDEFAAMKALAEANA